MIKANHTYWFQLIFRPYMKFILKKHFREIQFEGDVKDKGLPLLVIANHISWWDGFWILNLNEMLFNRKFFVMMLEEQLSKNLFLSRLGAFSIRRKNKSAAESINYASELLQNPANMLLLFPQGGIRSQYSFPLEFEKGWGRILLKQNNPVQILMVANLLDYSSHPKPRLHQYVFSPPETSGFSCEMLETVYNDFYKGCMEKQTMGL